MALSGACQSPLQKQQLSLPSEQEVQRHQPLLLPFRHTIKALQLQHQQQHQHHSRHSPPAQPFRLCIVGGGYICHALSCVLQPLVSSGVVELSVLSHDLQAAAQKQKQEQEQANGQTPPSVPPITCTFTSSQHLPPLHGSPTRVSSHAEEVIPQADMILLTVLANQRIDGINTVLPLIDTSRVVMLGSVNGGGGFDLVALRMVHRYYKQHPVAAGKDHATNRNLILFGFQDQPYLCSKLVLGKSVLVTATARQVNLALASPYNSYQASVLCNLVQALLQIPTYYLPYYLSISLSPIYAIMPSLMFARFGPYSQWSSKPLPQQPSLHEMTTELSAYFLQRCDDELQQIAQHIERMVGINLEIAPLRHHLKTLYGDQIGDNSTLYQTLLTNAAYTELHAPLQRTKDPTDGSVAYSVDTSHRVFQDSIPYGLVLLKDIADILKIGVPRLDSIINWAQALMKEQYLVRDRSESRKAHYINQRIYILKGNSMIHSKTAAPTVWGITTLQQLTINAHITKVNSYRSRSADKRRRQKLQTNDANHEQHYEPSTSAGTSDTAHTRNAPARSSSPARLNQPASMTSKL